MSNVSTGGGATPSPIDPALTQRISSLEREIETLRASLSSAAPSQKSDKELIRAEIRSAIGDLPSVQTGRVGNLLVLFSIMVVLAGINGFSVYTFTRDALDDQNDKLAEQTKNIDILRNGVFREIDAFKADANGRLAGQKDDLEKDVVDLNHDTDDKIAVLKDTVDQKFTALSAADIEFSKASEAFKGSMIDNQQAFQNDLLAKFDSKVGEPNLSMTISSTTIELNYAGPDPNNSAPICVISLSGVIQNDSQFMAEILGYNFNTQSPLFYGDPEGTGDWFDQAKRLPEEWEKTIFGGETVRRIFTTAIDVGSAVKIVGGWQQNDPHRVQIEYFYKKSGNSNGSIKFEKQLSFDERAWNCIVSAASSPPAQPTPAIPN